MAFLLRAAISPAPGEAQIAFRRTALDDRDVCHRSNLLRIAPDSAAVRGSVRMLVADVFRTGTVS